MGDGGSVEHVSLPPILSLAVSPYSMAATTPLNVSH